MGWTWTFSLSFLFLAALSLCCGKEAPHCSARASLIVAGRFSCPLRGGILVPQPGIELMCTLHWKMDS